MGRPFDKPRDDHGMSMNEIDMELGRLRQERAMLIQRGTQKQMEPKDEQLINLAHEAGEMKAMWVGQKERADKQLETIKELRREANDLPGLRQDRDNWQRRALTAEEFIERSKRSRRAALKTKARRI